MRTVIFGKCQRTLEGDATKMQNAIDAGIKLLTRKRLSTTDIVDETFNKNLEMMLEVASLFFGKSIKATDEGTPSENPKFSQVEIEDYKHIDGDESAAIEAKLKMNNEALRSKVNGMSLKPADDPSLLQCNESLKSVARTILSLTDADLVKGLHTTISESLGQAKQLFKALNKAIGDVQSNQKIKEKAKKKEEETAQKKKVEEEQKALDDEQKAQAALA
eukprot:7401873-Alexandrium_andersonii.AAC.1